MDDVILENCPITTLVIRNLLVYSTIQLVQYNNSYNTTEYMIVSVIEQNSSHCSSSSTSR